MGNRYFNGCGDENKKFKSNRDGMDGDEDKNNKLICGLRI